MRFCSLSSGSSGNCLYIETSESKFLIDAGLSGVRVNELMEEQGLKASDLDFILVTHEHSDHGKGVGVLSRRYDLPVLANEGTWQGLYEAGVGNIKEKNFKVFETGRDFEYRDLAIKPVRIFHDANEPVAFVIYYKGKKVSIMTDTGMVSSSMVDDFKGSDMFFMEANYDENMLWNGPYPERLKRRVAGASGHLSNRKTAEFIARILSSGNEKVYLGHLSENNNLPILARNTVIDYLVSQGLNEEDINLEVAKRYSSNKIYEIG